MELARANLVSLHGTMDEPSPRRLQQYPCRPAPRREQGHSPRSLCVCTLLRARLARPAAVLLTLGACTTVGMHLEKLGRKLRVLLPGTFLPTGDPARPTSRQRAARARPGSRPWTARVALELITTGYVEAARDDESRRKSRLPAAVADGTRPPARARPSTRGTRADWRPTEGTPRRPAPAPTRGWARSGQRASA
jgi:hypothetical protein